MLLTILSLNFQFYHVKEYKTISIYQYYDIISTTMLKCYIDFKIIILIFLYINRNIYTAPHFILRLEYN